jgi:TolB-like protein/DNA-binding winged helix-turn-helix (wHTH) protein
MNFLVCRQMLLAYNPSTEFRRGEQVGPERPQGRVYRFGVFELDLDAEQLRKAGVLIRLQPHPCKVLGLLVSQPGRLVTREELRRELWGNETFVDFEQGLNYCVRQIRAVLGDDAQTPRYIETLRRRGYRFIAPVEPLAEASSRPGDPAPVEPPARVEPQSHPILATLHARTAPGVAAALVVALLLAIAWAARRPSRGARSHGPKVMLAVLPFANLSGQPEQDSFSVGLTEDLVARLVGLHDDRVAVIPRDFSVRYQDRREPLAQVGRSLGADYLLVGSVRRNGLYVRITADLIDVHTGTDRWAQTYDLKLGNILAMQSKVGQAIADEIIGKLSPQQ